MRIHTDKLSAVDLVRALPGEVRLNVMVHGSRKRKRAFEVTLYVFEKDELHRRYGNSGGYGSSEDVAATWDEWGEWIAALYKLDPKALIGWYESPEDFRAKTRHHRDYVRHSNKPTSLAYRTHTAPWLSHGGNGTRGVGAYKVGGIVSARG